MSGKPRRTTPATTPGAVNVPAGREPDVVEPETTTSPPRPPSRQGSIEATDRAAKQKGRRTARPTAPGAVSVTAVEPEPESAPSRPVGSNTADVAAKQRGRRTSARNVIPGAVSVPPEEPSQTAAAIPTAPSSDIRMKNRARRASRTSTPGAVSVAGGELENTTDDASSGLSKADAAAKERGRRTSRGTLPGAVRVEVDLEEPSEVVTERSSEVQQNLGVPSPDKTLRKKRRATPASQPGAVRVDGNESETATDSQNRKQRLTSPSGPETAQVEPLPTATTTVAAYGMSKPARVSTGAVSVPGAVSVVQDNEHVQERALVDERAAGRKDNEGKDNEDEAKNTRNSGVSHPGAQPMDGLESRAPGARSIHGGQVADKDVTKLNGEQDDYMQRMEDKVKQMETDLGGPQDDIPDEEVGKKEFDEETPTAGILPPPVVDPVTTTTDYGMAGVPGLEYGEIGGGQATGGFDYTGFDDGNLVVAQPVPVDEEDVLLPSAIEYDPDSKPPIHQNRRFRLYFVAGILLLVVICVGVGVGIGASSEPPRPATLNPTGAPTSTPSFSREQEYREIFKTLVGPQVNVRGSPHDLAADWIIFEDPRELSSSDLRLSQRYLSVLFWFITTNGGADEWVSCNPPKEGETSGCIFLRFTRLNDDSITQTPEPAIRWLSEEDECRWVGNLCDDNQVTRALEFWGQNISGTLPTELSAFPFLQSISLAYNDFTGTIPVEYAQMRHLLNLELHANELTGTIPGEFWYANALQNFNIGENMLSGTVSTELGLLTNLKGLHIFENMLSGNFPSEVGNIDYLSFTRLDHNAFIGIIPSELGRLSLLQELWMHANGFTGNVPTELGLLTDLTDLRLAENNFGGKIPDPIYSLTQLTRLDLQRNRFSGTFSTRIGNLAALEILKVSRNQLTGPMPVEISQLSGLRLAWLHLNRFTGSVPTEYCNNRGVGLLQFLSSDCGPDAAPSTPCACCSNCCDRVTGVCLLQDDSG